MNYASKHLKRFFLSIQAPVLRTSTSPYHSHTLNLNPTWTLRDLALWSSFIWFLYGIPKVRYVELRYALNQILRALPKL